VVSVRIGFGGAPGARRVHLVALARLCRPSEPKDHSRALLHEEAARRAQPVMAAVE